MKQEALRYFTDLYMTKSALLLFVAAFVTILVHTYLLSRKSDFDAVSRLPLDEQGGN